MDKNRESRVDIGVGSERRYWVGLERRGEEEGEKRRGRRRGSDERGREERGFGGGAK